MSENINLIGMQFEGTFQRDPKYVAEFSTSAARTLARFSGQMNCS